MFSFVLLSVLHFIMAETECLIDLDKLEDQEYAARILAESESPVMS